MVDITGKVNTGLVITGILISVRFPLEEKCEKILKFEILKDSEVDNVLSL